MQDLQCLYYLIQLCLEDKFVQPNSVLESLIRTMFGTFLVSLILLDLNGGAQRYTLVIRKDALVHIFCMIHLRMKEYLLWFAVIKLFLLAIVGISIPMDRSLFIFQGF